MLLYKKNISGLNRYVMTCSVFVLFVQIIDHLNIEI